MALFGSALTTLAVGFLGARADQRQLLIAGSGLMVVTGLAFAASSSIASAPLETALGMKGGMFKVVVGRSATMHGLSVGREMGVNTWAAFAGSDEAAFVDFDFAMLENELQPVLRAMRQEGINIVAIHQHMSHEQPRYFFLHY